MLTLIGPLTIKQLDVKKVSAFIVCACFSSNTQKQILIMVIVEKRVRIAYKQVNMVSLAFACSEESKQIKTNRRLT